MNLGVGSSPTICTKPGASQPPAFYFQHITGYMLQDSESWLLSHYYAPKIIRKKGDKMKYVKPAKRKFFFKAPMDLNLIICVILLNIFGLIMIYSASYYYAAHNLNKAHDYFFTNQLTYVLIGISVMLLVSFFGPHFYDRAFFLVSGLALSLLLIVAVRIPSISHSSHGASRWLSFGSLSIQIAEPVKLFLIVFAACFLSRLSFTKAWHKTAVYFAVFGLTAFLLWRLSNNLSTAIIIFLNAFFLKMINSRDMRNYFIAMIVVAVIALIGLILIEYAIPYSDQESFRITRIRAWLHPEDPDFTKNQGYQARLALYAIASGGFFGKGLGQSLIKFRLPEPHNDYILAIIFEELGIFGVLILTYLFCYLLYRIYLVYTEARSRFSANLVLGVFLHLSLQVVMNYGVTLGLLPTMGVTLTFISAGGTSVVFTFIELGLVLSCARETAAAKAHEKALAQVSEGNAEIIELINRKPEGRMARFRLPAFIQRIFRGVSQ